MVGSKYLKQLMCFVALGLGIAFPAFAGDLVLSTPSSNQLKVSYGSQSVVIQADGAWKATTNAGTTTYSYSGPVHIGQFSIGHVKAQIGPKGGKLVTAVGLGFGNLTLSAGEIALELMPGDQLVDAPSFAKFGRGDIVLYAAIDTGVSLAIGSQASFVIPTPVDADMKLLVEFANGSLYIEGPIPTPISLANGANRFVRAVALSSSKGNVLTGGIGFSLDSDFRYTSEYKLYAGAGKSPAQDDFAADVVLIGQFDLADMATVDGQLMLNTNSGKLGFNGAASLGFSLNKAEATMTPVKGSYVVDGSGLRFGYNMAFMKDMSLPSTASNIAQLLSPMSGVNVDVAGYATSHGAFQYNYSAAVATLGGLQHYGLAYGLGTESLSVETLFAIDGLGRVKASGMVSQSNCYLEIEKFKFLDFDLGHPKVKPCDVAKPGTLAFMGELKLLGQSVMVDGVSQLSQAASAFLSRDHAVSAAVSVREKFGVSGGLSGGYVKLASDGSVKLSLSATGKLSADVNLASAAKFCGKVDVAGKKLTKCKTMSAGIDPRFDVSLACFNFSASTQILGQQIRISDNRVCPWPASGGYTPDTSAYSSGDGLSAGDEGGAIALRSYTGAYVSWPADYYILQATATSVSPSIGFSMINMDEPGQCPRNGTNVVLRLGDAETLGANQYAEQQKKGAAVIGKETNYNSGTKASSRFYIEGVRMTGPCVSDGDVIRLRNKAFDQYWTVKDGHIEGHSNDANNPNQRFTVVFQPGW